MKTSLYEQNFPHMSPVWSRIFPIEAERAEGSYIYATDGTTDAWYRLWQMCQAGFTTNAAYFKALGCNPDGSRLPLGLARNRRHELESSR